METRQRLSFEPDKKRNKVFLRLYYANDDLRQTGHQTKYPLMTHVQMPYEVGNVIKWQIKKLLFEHLENLKDCHCITLLYCGENTENKLVMCKFRLKDEKIAIYFRKDNQKLISVEGINEHGELFPRNTDLLGSQTKYWVDWFDENNNIKEEHEEMFKFIIDTRNEFLAELSSRETVEIY